VFISSSLAIVRKWYLIIIPLLPYWYMCLFIHTIQLPFLSYPVSKKRARLSHQCSILMNHWIATNTTGSYYQNPQTFSKSHINEKLCHCEMWTGLISVLRIAPCKCNVYSYYCVICVHDYKSV